VQDRLATAHFLRIRGECGFRGNCCKVAADTRTSIFMSQPPEFRVIGPAHDAKADVWIPYLARNSGERTFGPGERFQRLTALSGLATRMLYRLS
jgi:hypothetical protein